MRLLRRLRDAIVAVLCGCDRFFNIHDVSSSIDGAIGVDGHTVADGHGDSKDPIADAAIDVRPGEELPACMPELADDFDAPSLDVTRWIKIGAGATVSGNELNINFSPGQSVNGVLSANRYGLTNRSVSAELVMPAAGDPALVTTLGAAINASNYFQLTVGEGNSLELRMTGASGGVAFELTPVVYAATMHRFLRIRHDNIGLVFFEWSMDNAVWNELGSKAVAPAFAAAQFGMNVSGGGIAASSATGVFDNFVLSCP